MIGELCEEQSHGSQGCGWWRNTALHSVCGQLLQPLFKPIFSWAGITRRNIELGKNTAILYTPLMYCSGIIFSSFTCAQACIPKIQHCNLESGKFRNRLTELCMHSNCLYRSYPMKCVGEEFLWQVLKALRSCPWEPGKGRIITYSTTRKCGYASNIILGNMP